MTTKTETPSAARPMGPWPDFQSCVDHMTDKEDYSEEEAKRVCGKIKAEQEDTAATRQEPPPPMRFPARIAKVDTTARTVPIVASTPNEVEGEAIDGWDLERFLKNPVVLWAHDGEELPIGVAQDVSWDPVVGLRMTVRFAREAANPRAEQIYQGVIDGIVRAVSVGYDRAPTPGRAALLEVSFVPIGRDEDAGTGDLNPAATEDERLARRVSLAASQLAKHRARKRAAGAAAPCDDCAPEAKMDRAEGLPELRMDRAPVRLDKFQRTPTDGIVFPARLSRTGVLSYRLPDGTTRRELRTAEEIFRADSLASLEHGAVIDVRHHTGMVTPETWKDAAVGHVSNVRRDGAFIVGDVVVQHGDALDAIVSGERVELSCGYRCRLDTTPGVHEGEAYDAVQRDITYNHVALCPPNGGRAGPEVGLRLDGEDDNQRWAVARLEEGGEQMAIRIRLDGREMDEGSKEHLDALERGHKAEVERLDAARRAEVKAEADGRAADKAEAQKRLDAADGARDAAAKEVEALKLDAKEKASAAEKQLADLKAGEAKRIMTRLRLVRSWVRFFGDDEEDEEKMDARLDSMSDRDLMLDVIKKRDANFDPKDRSDDYVQARFDAVVDLGREDARIGGVARRAQLLPHQVPQERADGADDPVSKARAARDAAYRDAWKPPAQH